MVELTMKIKEKKQTTTRHFFFLYGPNPTLMKAWIKGMVELDIWLFSGPPKLGYHFLLFRLLCGKDLWHYQNVLDSFAPSQWEVNTLL